MAATSNPEGVMHVWTIIQGRRNSNTAAGAVKQLRAMETYKNQKIVTNYACFCSGTTLT